MRLVGHANCRVAGPRVLAIDQHGREHFTSGGGEFLAHFKIFGQLIGIRNCYHARPRLPGWLEQ